MKTYSGSTLVAISKCLIMTPGQSLSRALNLDWSWQHSGLMHASRKLALSVRGPWHTKNARLFKLDFDILPSCESGRACKSYINGASSAQTSSWDQTAEVEKAERSSLNVMNSSLCLL